MISCLILYIFLFEEMLQREAENLMSSVQENIADKEKNAELLNIGRPMDEDALQELYTKRAEWLQETLTQTVENVLEAEFEVALTQAIESMDHTFDMHVLTEEERVALSKTHMVTCLQERVKNKRVFGKRLAFLG